MVGRAVKFFVIASVARQSRDCFVAAAPRNDFMLKRQPPAVKGDNLAVCLLIILAHYNNNQNPEYYNDKKEVPQEFSITNLQFSINFQ